MIAYIGDLFLISKSLEKQLPLNVSQAYEVHSGVFMKSWKALH
jgi:hypothetical protein